jgi:hypothetical protein
LPRPVAIDTRQPPSRHPQKGLAPAQAQRDHHVVTGCRLLILIAAPFSSRLSRYSKAGAARFADWNESFAAQDRSSQELTHEISRLNLFSQVLANANACRRSLGHGPLPMQEGTPCS